MLFKILLKTLLKVLFKPLSILFLWIIFTLYKTYEHRKEWEEVCLTKILDGDTIEYKLREFPFHKFKGRLLYIDAFEKNQPVLGRISFKGLEKKLPKIDRECPSIYIFNRGEDIYKRKLIFLKKFVHDPETINEKLIKRGEALLYQRNKYYSLSEKRLWQNWQDIAKRTKQGIWKLKRKKSWLMPWSYRKKMKKVKDFNSFS